MLDRPYSRSLLRLKKTTAWWTGTFRTWNFCRFYNFGAQKADKSAVAIFINFGSWSLLHSWNSTAHSVMLINFSHKVHRRAERNWRRDLSWVFIHRHHFCCTLAVDLFQFGAFAVRPLPFYSVLLVLRNSLLFSRRELARGQRKPSFFIFFQHQSFSALCDGWGNEKVPAISRLDLQRSLVERLKKETMEQFQNFVVGLWSSVVVQRNWWSTRRGWSTLGM